MSRVGEQLQKARLDAGYSVKQLGKKLGVSEGFVTEVESGRRVVNEDLLKRFTKVFGKDVTKMGLGSLEESVDSEVTEEKKKEAPKPKETYKAPVTPVNDLWNQAFGDNIKNIPIYDYDLKTPVDNKTYAVKDKKIEGQPQDKVVGIRVKDDDMAGFRIMPKDIVLGYEVKEIQGLSFMLVEYGGRRAIRRVRNLNNGNVMLTSFKANEKSETLSIKEVRPVLKIFKVEFFV